MLCMTVKYYFPDGYVNKVTLGYFNLVVEDLLIVLSLLKCVTD